jgi:alanyl-tRNA synthetase
MKADDLRKKYLEFFKSKQHKEIPNVSLIPQNDPTVLFTTAGMHPLVPYLLGQPHPLGKRLVNIQKCVRTVDIDEIQHIIHSWKCSATGLWEITGKKMQ